MTVTPIGRDFVLAVTYAQYDGRQGLFAFRGSFRAFVDKQHRHVLYLRDLHGINSIKLAPSDPFRAADNLKRYYEQGDGIRPS